MNIHLCEKLKSDSAYFTKGQNISLVCRLLKFDFNSECCTLQNHRTFKKKHSEKAFNHIEIRGKTYVYLCFKNSFLISKCAHLNWSIKNSTHSPNRVKSFKALHLHWKPNTIKTHQKVSGGINDRAQ